MGRLIDTSPAELHVKPKPKKTVRGMAYFEIKDDYEPSEMFLIQHTHQRIASHPRVLQCG